MACWDLFNEITDGSEAPGLHGHVLPANNRSSSFALTFHHFFCVCVHLAATSVEYIFDHAVACRAWQGGQWRQLGGRHVGGAYGLKDLLVYLDEPWLVKRVVMRVQL